MKKTWLTFLLTFFLSACSGSNLWGSYSTLPASLDSTTTPTLLPSATSSSQMVFHNLPSGTPTPTLAQEAWKSMPIIPEVSPRMVTLFQSGLAAGRDPARFSKIGDCQNITTYFLAAFDDPDEYRLGPEYSYLQTTIDHFSGSWSRESLAVKGGMNVAAVQNPSWILTPRPEVCNAGETPLGCELRIHNPSLALVSMEESWSGDLERYEYYLRLIVEDVLSRNIIPILATRADLLATGDGINAVVARVAYDYQVPLWNFWLAAYPLPYHGLRSDGFHLTKARSFFDDPLRMQAGWAWRNLTALEVLDRVYQTMSEIP